MDAKKIQNFVVPFLITVSAVVVGLAAYGYYQKRRAKKVMAGTAATAAVPGAATT
jgi:uncharacterized membrane protein AbrB (regulator of aidB expression)